MCRFTVKDVTKYEPRQKRERERESHEREKVMKEREKELQIWKCLINGPMKSLMSVKPLRNVKRL